MSFCRNCGKELLEGAAFCAACGAAASPVAPDPITVEGVDVEQVAEEQVIPTAPVEAADTGARYAQEKECLDTYYRLLKWERIAWSICGKFFLVICCIFFGLCGLLWLVALASGESELLIFSAIYLIYPLMFLPIAIVNLKMVKKVQYYMDTLYTDIRPTVKRSESIGMIVLEYFFNEVALIFYIINFARTKCNKDVIARIIAHQQEGR